MGKRWGVPPALFWLIVLIASISAGGCGGLGGPGAAVEGTGGSGDTAGPEESTSIESASAHGDLPQERTGQYDRPRASESRGEGTGSPVGAYVPAGFGEGSLWATDLATCNDSAEALLPGEYDDAGAEAAACSAPAGMSLKRLDPETGEEEAAIELDGFFANITEVAFGAGSVWVSSADYHPGPGGLPGRRRAQGRPRDEPGRGPDTPAFPLRRGLRVRLRWGT